MPIPLANDFHTVLELSHLGGPIVGVGAFIGAGGAYVGSSSTENRGENAKKGFLGGAIVTFLLILGNQEAL
jgi:hypothetical protein